MGCFNKKSITVIGHFAEGLIYLDGQTVKTRTLYDELKKTDLFDIKKVDTHNWKHNAFKLMKMCAEACKNDDYVFMMIDINGFRAMAKILPRLCKNHSKLIYIVIGGWVYDFLVEHKSYIPSLKLFDAVVCETEKLKNNLEKIGFENLYVVPNFKRLEIVNTLSPVASYPYRFCTFSRVSEEKGIEDAVECIKKINTKYDNEIVTLDIFGPVQKDYEEKFNDLKNNLPDYIRYKGIVDYDESVETLKNYYALLFPTTFYAECHAGTVIDAFASGLPVICYEWKYSDDLITHGVEGLVCKPGVDNLVRLVEEAINDQDKMLQMRFNCVNKAKEYLPDVNIEKIIGILMQLQNRQ